MRVSIAMAVRDSERYLPELLASLAAQTLAPYELIVHDDASTDGTPEVLADFRERAGFPVDVERSEEHRGHVPGFLAAAARCGGDAVAFCDGDDVWREDKLAVCVQELSESGAALVLHATRAVDADLGDLGVTWPAIDRTRTVPPLGLTGLGVDAPGMAMVFRREVLELLGDRPRPSSRYDPEREMLHDEWALFLGGVLGAVRLVAPPLVLYRQHGANDSGGWVRRDRTRTLAPATDDYRRAAVHTRACARFLDRAAGAHPHLAERLRAGARHYEACAASWEHRLSLYAAQRRRARGRLLWRLLAARAYRRRRSGGLGASALAKDLVGGLVLRVTDR